MAAPGMVMFSTADGGLTPDAYLHCLGCWAVAPSLVAMWSHQERDYLREPVLTQYMLLPALVERQARQKSHHAATIKYRTVSGMALALQASWLNMQGS